MNRPLRLPYVLLVILLASCGGNTGESNTGNGQMQMATAAQQAVPFNCGAFCDTPSVSYNLPTDACNLTAQNVMNCFAWKTFLALNWLASPNAQGLPDSTLTGADYGVPGDLRPTVWESYWSAEEIFTPASLKLMATGSNHIKRLDQLSKIGVVLNQVDKKRLKAAAGPGGNKMEEIFQAKGKWLTDQSGNLVWYEVKANILEKDFIRNNNLYNYNALKAYAVQNGGVWLPTGSMELKAAWKVVPAQDVERLKPYYKMSKAMVPKVLGFDANQQPILGDYTEQYLALVGLHIIHKTPLAPQFIWMTFEHIHNAPTENAVDSTISYSFFNPLSKDTPNISPQPGKDSLNAPVQVVRIANNALTPEIKQLNQQVQAMIRRSNPKSVWQYYQLVNVQWPQNPVQDNANNKIVPLQMGGITPSNIANTTMETYIQGTQCMSCHQFGGVDHTDFPTDYSFLFIRAKASSATTLQVSEKDADKIKKMIRK